jgi:hypothetical protein
MALIQVYDIYIGAAALFSYICAGASFRLLEAE